jgi:2-phosphosulfolactate phosphatase
MSRSGSESERPAVFVHLLPTSIAAGALRGGVAVVADVLRATTVMVSALAQGCEAVIPCGEVEEAVRVASGWTGGPVILGGERQGLPIPGFDLGNSPGDFVDRVCRGKTLVMTTTNGTRALLASREGDRVFVVAFPNLSATVAVVAPLPCPVHVVCSGTDGRVSFEDATLAGAVVRSLCGSRPPGNDEALIVAALWDTVAREVETGRELPDVLSKGRGGRRVCEIGLSADIAEAARVDRFPIVAEMLQGPLRVVRTGP